MTPSEEKTGRPLTEEDRYDGDRQKKREFLCRVLGRNSFQRCSIFFKSVWSSCATYKVFISRRCLNLMAVFYESAAPEWKSGSGEKSFFSEDALLSDAPAIAETYAGTSAIPPILIVDDVLIHGRTINTLIRDLTDRIYQALQEKGCQVDRVRLQTDVLYSIRIRVLLQSDRKILLYGAYQNRLKAEEICPLSVWHAFSSDVSQVISSGVIANTSFVPSLRTQILPKGGEKLYRRLSEKADRLARPFAWRNRFLEKAWVRPVTAGSGEVKALCTLRVVPSEMDGTRLIIPTVLAADMQSRKVKQILRQKFWSCLDTKQKEASEEIFTYWQDDAPAVRGSLSFLLSQNMLLLLLQDCGVEWEKAVDYEKIALSFRSRVCEGVNSFFDAVAARKTPWMSWQEMDETLLDLTEGAKPLFHGSESCDVRIVLPEDRERECIEKVWDALGDTLSEYGQEAEYHAFRQSTGKEYPSGLQSTAVPLSDVLAKLYTRIERDVSAAFLEEDFLCCAVSLLLRYMDMGAAALSQDCARERYITGVRAGEQCQFVLPQRYASYLPVLIELERDCLWNLDRLLYQMRKLLTPVLDEKLLEGLVDFVKSLYREGQCLQDWKELDQTGWLDWKWEKSCGQKTLKPKDVQRRKLDSFASSMMIQNKMVDAYLSSRK